MYKDKLIEKALNNKEKEEGMHHNILTNDELSIYGRQIIFPQLGKEGQERLKNSKVFVAGAGGLGSPVSIYLAVAGIGTIVICDYDIIEITNLNRQILHNLKRINRKKALSAEETLKEINPYVKVVPQTKKIEEGTVEELVGDSAIIVDCMDNFPTRYILNKYAVSKGIPYVYGSIWGMDGQLSFIKVPETPCLRCIFPEAPPREVFPVFGVTPGIIGCLQAMETIKYLASIGDNLKNKLLVFNGLNMEFSQFNINPDHQCPVCSKRR